MKYRPKNCNVKEKGFSCKNWNLHSSNHWPLPGLLCRCRFCRPLSTWPRRRSHKRSIPYRVHHQAFKYASRLEITAPNKHCFEHWRVRICSSQCQHASPSSTSIDASRVHQIRQYPTGLWQCPDLCSHYSPWRQQQRPSFGNQSPNHQPDQTLQCQMALLLGSHTKWKRPNPQSLDHRTMCRLLDQRASSRDLRTMPRT